MVTLPETLPARPALQPWYRILHEEDRLLLQYGETLVCFEGRAVSRLLPALLPLLDGSRSVDEIVEVLGLAARPAVVKALALLNQHGLLSERTPGGVDDSARRSAEFLAATDPLGRAPPALIARLERAAVAVVGSGPLAAEVASSLRRSGLGGLERLPLDGAQAALERLELAVTAPAGEELPELSAWNQSALRAALSWLQVLPFDGLFAAGSGTPSVEQAVAGLAATLALRWLVHRDQFLPGTWYALELGPQPALQAHVLYRVPRCRACSGLGRTAQPLPWHKGAAAL